MNNQQKEDSATLEILQVIEDKEDITQRHIADKLDVALGLANSYLKRCVHKGLVKIHQAPANRYFYYLTPKGFAEKSRLTSQFLSHSFDFYRRSGDCIAELFSECERKNKLKILFCGVSELAEIASIRAHEFNIEIIGTFDPNKNKKSFIDFPVWNNFADIDEFDVCLLTSLDKSEKNYEFLRENLNKEKIMVPEILGINHKN